MPRLNSGPQLFDHSRSADASGTPTADVAGPSRPQPEAATAPSHHPLPVWLQRTFLVILVIFCVELGLLLIAIPWTSIWTENVLLRNSPRLREFLAHGFVRGCVSGLGFLDIWLGIWEAVHYRDRKKV